MPTVWIDWGSGRPEDLGRYDFRSLKELNAFLEGVSEASFRWDIDDFQQFDTQEEVDAWRKRVARDEPELMNETHYGAVCAKCGKGVTEAEYTLGKSACCSAPVIGEEDYQKEDNDESVP